ncbi:class D beta-lactamase [Massilia sp. ST3]|uniref:class D beta-lactamase n=1 Tax=Massilia sp. ST3 TaxID=2824903 RepID=UPI001B811EDC|nr:class D beta-lactamase [Massilia sp. ST3]MBQ5949811.1 class D beta-lactamase [Massilia sp. ST3]
MHAFSRTVGPLLLLLAVQYAQAAQAALPEVDIGARFREAGVEGTFVLLDGQSGELRRHAPDRAARRFLPASTYKIPNTLVALESGVAGGKDFGLAWDSVRTPRQPWWPAAWARDHTLESALKHSAVWYYQEVARRVGPARMQSYVDRFGYGNRDLSGGIDRFWLTGGLRISADEQAAFLRRFYFEKLGVSARTTRLAKEMLVLEETPDYRLSGKSGWAGLGEEGQPQLGWLVGYLERKGEVHFFALNLDIARPQDAGARMAIVKAVLRDHGLLPAQPQSVAAAK